MTITSDNYLTLRLVSSLNNPQNTEMNFCENIKFWHVENHHNLSQATLWINNFKNFKNQRIDFFEKN
jgi:hypothetical protein